MACKGGWYVGLTTLPPSCVDCLEIWKPQPAGTVRACPGLLWDCYAFTFTFYLLNMRLGGSQSWFEHFEEVESCLAPARIWTPDRPSRSALPRLASFTVKTSWSSPCPKMIAISLYTSVTTHSEIVATWPSSLAHKDVNETDSVLLDHITSEIIPGFLPPWPFGIVLTSVWILEQGQRTEVAPPV